MVQTDATPPKGLKPQDSTKASTKDPTHLNATHLEAHLEAPLEASSSRRRRATHSSLIALSSGKSRRVDARGDARVHHAAFALGGVGAYGMRQEQRHRGALEAHGVYSCVL